jgi:hypothetical protein
VVPGWLVLAFALAGLLLPLAAIEDAPLGGRQMRLNQIIWAAMYGAPTLVAAVVFGIANLRRGRDVSLSRLGLVIAGICTVALPLVLLLH